jgi:hypothetical protein
LLCSDSCVCRNTDQSDYCLYNRDVVASAALQIDAYPLPISIDLCPNEVAAESFLHTIAASPNLMHPQRNQRLVMYLPMWGNDTDAMAAKVKGVFSSFQPKPH